MKIGDYVRTEFGKIHKITDLKPFYENGKLIEDRQAVYIDGKDSGCIYWQFKKLIIKSSPNIIDLIKVGDVIVCDNKKYPINYEFEVDYNDDYKDYEITIDDYITLFLKDGLSIVTKEQFKIMEYKVGE